MRSNLTRLFSALAVGLTCSVSVAALHPAQAPLMASTPAKPLKNTGLTSSEINSRLLISDVISRTSRIGIFSSFTRDADPISDMLDDSGFNATVLAPEDAAVRRLPRKPWEDPVDYEEMGENAYMGDDGRKRAADNLRRFVEAHIVARSPWRAGDRVKTLAGREVWYEDEGDKKYIFPGKIEVVEVADEVANGQVWIITDTLNYAR